MDEVLHILQARYPGYTIIDGTQSRHFRMFRLKAWWGRITHMVGFHWYIEGETYDSATNSVKYSGYHCFYCDREP